MTKTKFTASISLTIIHREGVRLRRGAVAQRLKTILELSDPDADIEVVKAVVRDIDLD